jgi:predicted Zn-ribbon and HTH transcriptional regulator
MSFERPERPSDAWGRDSAAEDHVPRPTQCPECRSKSIGTLAKVITADTYWRCQACGMVWNEARCRTSAPQRRW